MCAWSRRGFLVFLFVCARVCLELVCLFVCVCVCVCVCVHVVWVCILVSCKIIVCACMCFLLCLLTARIRMKEQESGLYATSDGSVLTRARKESLYYTAPLYAVWWWE